MNILVHACYINPNKGSEFSVSWEKGADFFEKCYAMAMKDRGEKRI